MGSGDGRAHGAGETRAHPKRRKTARATRGSSASRRALWRAVVTFGSVRVPVRMYTGVRSNRVQFHVLHDKDRQPVRQVMVNPLRGEPVEPDGIVWGYPLGDDEYVILKNEELEALEPESGRTIEVQSFAKHTEVDERYFDRPYYLGPDGDDGAYAALRAALEKSGRLGICRWRLRKRSYVGALGVSGGALSLVTLRYADEIVPTEELKAPKAELREKELKTARYLIDQLSGPWTPERYPDEYEAKLRELIAKKAKGQKVVLKRVRIKLPTKPGDLLRTLERSVKQVQKGA